MIKGRVKETSTTTGTGTLSLAGAVSGFRTFVNAFGTGNNCYYVIVHGTAWEVGIGTVTSGSPDTLTRTTVLDSSGAGAILTLGAGTKSVFNDTPANLFPHVGTKQISGLTYNNNATDAVNDINIHIGGCMDATGVYWMNLKTALGKRLDAAWAVGGTTGTPVGGLDTGAVGNNGYYLWLIARSDSGVVDALFSLSSTAPTMPTNYNVKRLIGWIKREAAANVQFFTYETAGGGLELLWNTPVLDISLANTLTTTERTDALNVPSNFSVQALIVVEINDTAAGATVHVSCPDTANGLNTNMIRMSAVNEIECQQIEVRTSATGTIAAIANVATVDVYNVWTQGFSWARRN